MKNKAAIIIRGAIVTSMLVIAANSWAADTGGGYVVGRLYLKLDGYQEQKRSIIEAAQVEIAQIIDNKVTKLSTKTDKNGYFCLKVKSLTGGYMPYSILNSMLKTPLKTPVPDPIRGVAIFGGGRDGFLPIVDCGEMIISIRPKGALAVTRTLGTNKSTLDFSTKERFFTAEGSFGYPGLDYYYANSSNPDLSGLAKRAITANKSLASAKKAFAELPKDLKVGDMADQCLKVLNIDPGVEDAETQLAFFWSLMKRQNDFLDAMKKLASDNPGNPWAESYLVDAHLRAGNVTTALQSAISSNKSFVFLKAYEYFFANYRFVEASTMLEMAISTYKDNLLYNVSYSELLEKKKRFANNSKSKMFFADYLKRIEIEDDCENWNVKPYTRFLQRNPLAKPDL